MDDSDADIDIFTKDDREFTTKMNSIDGSSPIAPARKHRRGQHRRMLSVASQMPDRPILTSTASSRPSICADAPKSPGDGITTLKENGNNLARAAEANRRNAQAPEILNKKLNPTPKDTLLLQPLLQELKNSSCSKELGKAISHPAAPDTASGERPPELPDRISINSALAGGDHAPSIARRILAPNRVFASFNGQPAGHFPATCLGTTGPNGSKYRVRFDDGTCSTISEFGVRRLELKKGDIVKIDLANMWRNTYVVLELLDKQDIPVTADPQTASRVRRRRGDIATDFPQVDVYGHSKVLVRLKQKKPTPGVEAPRETVPLTTVYVALSQWSNFKDRLYSYSSSSLSQIPGIETPSDRPSTPSTPTSRNKRIKESNTSHSKVSLISSVARRNPSLFDNMVFGITNVQQSIRPQIVEHIQSHGGQLLEDGFHGLFRLPNLDKISSSKPSSSESTVPFELTPSACHRGFTCLVADDYCRLTKYAQALALGIPCLATRWVQDCVKREKLLPWEPYLLASGKSDYLNAIRSRVLPSYPPDAAKLPDIIASRPTFLKGTSVLLVMSKSTEDRMKAFPFIAYALGALRVSWAGSFEAAKQMLLEAEDRNEVWDWVCHHDSDRTTLSQAEQMLFSSGDTRAGKKRKRGVSEVVRHGKTRVVVTNFVVQSLIMGSLVEED
jgi:tRNA-splicing endonuclease subunit Sen2